MTGGRFGRIGMSPCKREAAKYGIITSNEDPKG